MAIQGRKGGKGGGGGGPSFHEDPNNLRSNATAKVLDLISEGEIYGLVDGLKSIYFNDVPVQNADGSMNFNGVNIEFRNGTMDQDYLAGFSNVETYYGVGTEVKYGFPVTHHIQDENIDAIIITIQVPALSRTDTSSGSILATSFQFGVDVRADGGMWQTLSEPTVSGKCSSSFQRSYYYKLPPSENGDYDVRVRRITPDSDTSTVTNAFSWSGITQVIEAKLNYAGRAVCATTVKADQFGGDVPNRKYEIYGLIINIPSNYDPWTRTYDGIWDGTFKRGWTNNPAWVFYDLVTNPRYGLGRDILPEYVDKYGLYMIGRYCDELVSDGHGGMEPRFTFNGSIVNRESAYSILNKIAGAFNSMIYYSGTSIVLVQDSPKSPIRDFSPANVLNGLFNYEGVGRSARHSVFQVTWTNPENQYQGDIEAIELPDMIQDTGWNVNEITLLGCTSRAQARRRALRDLYTEQHETETVSFSVSVENADIAPGDIIRISDPSYAGVRYGGRIADIDTESGIITLDFPVEFEVESTYHIGLLLPDNTWIEKPIANPEVKTDKVQLQEKLSVYPNVGTVWSLQCDNVEPRLFRVLSIKEEKPYQFSITALQHYAQKYDVIEKGADFVDGHFSKLPTGIIKAPIELGAEEYMHRVGNSVLVSILFSWQNADPRAITFLVQYKRKIDDLWVEVGYTSQENITIDDTEKDTYYLRVRAVDALGRFSAWSEMEFEAVGYDRTPGTPTGFYGKVDHGIGVNWYWDPSSEWDTLDYVLQLDTMADRVSTTQTNYLQRPFNFTGTLNAKLYYHNIADHLSEEPATASVEILPPKKGQILSAELLDSGIVARWADAFQCFDISQYRVISCGDTDVQIYAGTSASFVKPIAWNKNSSISVMARDILNNWGERSDEFTIKWYAPKIPDITLGFDPLTGKITVDWQDCRNDERDGTPQIDHYEVRGTLANQNNQYEVVEVKGTHYESIVPLTAYEYGTQQDEAQEIEVGTLNVSVIAVDRYGITSMDNAAWTGNASKSFEVLPPYNPINFGVTASPEGDSLILKWRDCKRTFAIDHYTVYDEFTDTTYIVDANYVTLPSRKEGAYHIRVQAFDVIGHSSAEVSYTMMIGGIGGMSVNARIDGADILVEWSIPDSSFALDHYLIKGDNEVITNPEDITIDNGDLLGTAKVNYFRMPAGKTGRYSFYIWAVDLAGNISSNYTSFAYIDVMPPDVPTVSAVNNGDSVGLSWVIEHPTANTLPIITYDVQRQDNLQVYPLESYGRCDLDKMTVPPTTAGAHTFYVRAVDSGGNVGEWGTVEFVATYPGRVTFLQPVIFNNVAQFYWTVPSSIFYTIKEYIFYEVEEGFPAMEVIRCDATYVSIQESFPGDYTYGVVAVDVAGNRSEMSKITVALASPPSYRFYHDYDSLFNGDKENFILDGNGHMLGSLKEAQTWEEQQALMKELAGTPVETWQEKIDHNWPTWLEPYSNEPAVYTEILDVGFLVTSSKILIRHWEEIIAGDPEWTCKIEISSDKESWFVLTDNGFDVYGTGFQYIRFTLTLKNAFVAISRINISLNVKELTDYGQNWCAADDNGEGWISELETPELTGTWIPFNLEFADVESIPRPSISNEDGYVATVVYTRILHPKGFRVFVKDKNGQRVSALVDWVAHGV